MVIDVPSLGTRRGSSGRSTTCGSGGSPTSAFPVPTAARAAGTCSWGRATTGPLPDSGFHVSHCRTTRALVLGRAFMVDNDPSVPADAIRKGFRISPYVPGAQGTAVASFLAGHAPLGGGAGGARDAFIEASGTSFNTIPPNDFGYWETVNELIQQEPPSASDPELLGMLARLGIVHGQPFKPDERMRKVLEDAAVVGNATARTVTFAFRPEEGFAYYPDSNWFNMLWVGGYEFLDPAAPDHRRRRRRRVRATGPAS